MRVGCIGQKREKENIHADEPNELHIMRAVPCRVGVDAVSNLPPS